MILPKGIPYCVISLFFFLILSESLLAQRQKKASPDSMRILTWKINLQSFQFDTLRVDTALINFQFYNPVYKMGLSQTYLGNLGLPAISNSFNDRNYTTPFLFMQALEPYMITPEKDIYYNSHRPYTNLMYTSGGPASNIEESMHVIHNQNISDKWNVGVNFTVYASLGLYPVQRTKDRVFVAHTSYLDKNYKLLASYNLNKFINQENGGLLADSTVNQKDQDYLPVNLYNAKNSYASNTFFLFQSLKFGGLALDNSNDSLPKRFAFPASVVSLMLRYDRTRKTFQDNDLNTPSPVGQNTDSAYFRRMYYYSNKYPILQSIDSAICRKFTASLRYALKEDPNQKVPIGLSFMLVPELLTYGYYSRLQGLLSNPDTTISLNKLSYTHNHFNLKGGASISRSESDRFKFVATGYFTFLGYEIGNYWLNGNLDMNFPYHSDNKLHLGATLRADKPDFFYTSFASNFEQWNNSFKSTFRNEVEGSYSMPHNFFLEAHFININQFVYFNDSGYPDQTFKNLLVMSGSLNKTFRIWKYVSVNKIQFQYSSNQSVLPLPPASVYLSNYLEFQPVKNVLLVQLGFDMYYHSKYYGYAYDPVTGCFHTQHDKMIGNYPFLDAFMNFKLKRTRFYLKYEHADFGLLPRDYFNALHYPMDRGIFRFGLSWAFYD